MQQTYKVIQNIEVIIDESKFTDQFLDEFEKHIFKFFDCRNRIDGHMKFLAEMYARGIIKNYTDESFEGYGVLSNMGIKFNLVDCYVDDDDC